MMAPTAVTRARIKWIVLLWMCWIKEIDGCPAMCSCKHSEYSVTMDCTFANLTSIPKEIPSNVTTLNLGSNFIQFITSVDFINLTDVKVIDLSVNNITYIEPDAFQNLRQLERILLNSNLVETIVNGTFANCKLKRLDLHDNHGLQYIESNTFANSSIELIDLDKCNVSFISKSTLAPLKDSLKYFHMSNAIAALDLEMGMFSGFSLLELTLNQNGLHAIDMLDNLTCNTIELKYNKLGNDAWTIFKLVHGLKELFLTENGITDINVAVEYPTLTVLVLANNHISNFHASDFQNLPNLFTLVLNSNELQVLPPNLAQYLPSIKILHLKDNHISKLDAGVLLGLSFIDIDVSDNQIQTFEETLIQLFDNDFEKKKFSITGNPLHCNCEVLWLSRWIKSLNPMKDKLSVYVGNCVWPSDTYFLSLKNDELKCIGPIVLFVKPDAAMVGQKLSLYCKGRGDPAPQITITDSQNALVVSATGSDNKTVQETAVMYQIDSLNCTTDFGQYTCTASSAGGVSVEQLYVNESMLVSGSSCQATPTPDVVTQESTTTVRKATTTEPKSAGSAPEPEVNGGLIAGIVVLVIVLVVVVLVGALCFYLKKSRQSYTVERNKINGDTQVAYTNEAAVVSDKI